MPSVIKPSTFVRCITLCVLMLGSLVASGGSSTRAGIQETDTGDGPYPAHIHAGTCDELGDVAHPLSEAAHPEGDPQGSEPTLRVFSSTTTIPVTLEDLLMAPHALNVHKSADDIGTYVACGDLGGVVVEGDLVIAMAERDDSGLSGIAVIREASNETEVRFYLSQATPDDDGNGAASTPAGSPAADASPAAEADVTVEIKDFAYRDGALEVKVGTTVEWVQFDTVPHTVTSIPGGDIFQSGKMSKGDVFSYTFTEPGTYEYFCEYHDNMKGTVIVT